MLVLLVKRAKVENAAGKSYPAVPPKVVIKYEYVFPFSKYENILRGTAVELEPKIFHTMVCPVEIPVIGTFILIIFSCGDVPVRILVVAVDVVLISVSTPNGLLSYNSVKAVTPVPEA